MLASTRKQHRKALVALARAGIALRDDGQHNLAANITESALELDSAVKTLDVSPAPAERADKAPGAISNLSTLRAAIDLAKGGGADFLPARRLIVKRATEMGEDAVAMVPPDWVATWKAASDGRRQAESAPAKPSAADAAAAAEASEWGGGVAPTVFDEDAVALVGDGERRGDLQRLLEASGLSPAEFEDACGKTRGTVRAALEAAGCDIAQVEQAGARRDYAVKLLDNDAAEGLPAQPDRDALGRVKLDGNFNIAEYLHNPVAREERWQRAQAVGGQTSRAAFEQLDHLNLQSGNDYLKGIEADRQLAGARQQAQVARAEGERPEQFAKTVAGIYGTNGRVETPPAPSITALDSGTPAPAKPLRFVELVDHPEGMKLLEAAGKLYTEKKVNSLDEGALIVTGGGPASSVGRPPAFPEERKELDETVKSWMERTGDSYITALETIVGATAPDVK